MKKSSIYTKTGDKGKTSLVGGKRVDKTHVRLDAYGTIDELNSFVGFLVCEVKDEELNEFLLFIQNKLFVVGSYLATEAEAQTPQSPPIITEEDIEALETMMDSMDAKLPKLTRFILPGGSESAARAHICRTICRRAERNVYRVADEFPIHETILIFLNRLSDFFFLTARLESLKTGKEMYWEQK
ncbi:MAG: cob(I)yrinic acid a,c-diamide adenosyltransferase [Dysgonamonadaceae bacterium]|jgi:cob(I)alamin adenosyltransferase|nr:cob(I)yrinic acid a,c-diamide adenosyltransferase [Dysgonamonadaceae bacterium]MDD3356771.1 cob(I)yrinic acid a,c-diamide adenosyltransferase [Dysgonamonadaceae bacterium]MDD3727967.1 cob(I)yrinic acid a,c-diamide adenosyltransferase [Dysgonamonadaceae bacterium]MDD4246485.1 cob(I)yrinic acid a,c-diamide adenosyltransferase [Dysgonamonadaceae bacterium]MDD4606186.1 cob(I)yrinic acid a,c-diamide adenosyltransferase [Dysgonamonadaceae bacterium]